VLHIYIYIYIYDISRLKVDTKSKKHTFYKKWKCLEDEYLEGIFRAFDVFRGLFAFIIYRYVKSSFDKISGFKG